MLAHCDTLCPREVARSFQINSHLGARLAYASFDRFPSPKGAATHIDAFTTAIAQRFSALRLFTVAPAEEELPFCSPPAPGVDHTPIQAEGGHLFERVRHFRALLWNHLVDDCQHNGPLDVLHVRSIFEGYPIAKAKPQFCRRLLYEVNGLPSIELKYHYPDIADDDVLTQKLRAQERACLEAADQVITVSHVNARHLESLGVAAEKIAVIPNGVDLDVFQERTTAARFPAADERPIELLYCGGLTSWQGVGYAVEALRLINRDAPARLTVVGPARPRQRKWLDNLAFDLGVFDKFRRLPPVGRRELAQLHHEADVVLAPLSRNDRNTKQGCCPLKVLEAMASGVPLVASDLEVVRELAENNQHALLVKPNSGKSIKDAVFRLQQESGLASRLARNARDRVVENWDWRVAQTKLLDVYKQLLDGSVARGIVPQVVTRPAAC